MSFAGTFIVAVLSACVGFAMAALLAAGATPRNCRECEYARNCRSWYGGTGCKYKEEIG